MILDDLLQSNIFVKEGSMIDYKSPKEYVNPFIDKVSALTDNFRVEVASKNTNKDANDLHENIAYGRYKIEAVLPEKYNVSDSDTVIGLIVALDNAKPIMKTYYGNNVFACMNLTVFNAQNVFQQEMSQNVQAIYSRAADYASMLDQKIQEYSITVSKLKSVKYAGSTLNEMTGKLLRGALRNPRLGSNVVIQGTRELDNSKSVYYAKDGETTAWNYYNAITEYIKGTDLLDRPNKTLYLSDLFLN